MSNVFSAPNKENNYHAYMVHVLAIIWCAVTAIIVSTGLLFFPDIWHRWLLLLVISLLIAAFNLTLNYFGYTRQASWSLTMMLWLYITIPCYSAGGIMAPSILSQMSVILTAGFLLGWRGGLFIGLLTMGADFGLAYLELIGRLPAPQVIHNPITRWISAIIPFGTILALQYYATNHLRSSLVAMSREIKRREEAEKVLEKTISNFEERVKELKTLYSVSRILQDEDLSLKDLFTTIVEILPHGWQYPPITAARIFVDDAIYTTTNYKSSPYFQKAEIQTANGTKLLVEIVYLEQMPEMDEGPFLKEERSLINMTAEMLKMNLEWRERRAELKDYKYALDIGSILAISDAESHFTFVNDNFCKASKYGAAELLGMPYNIIDSGIHSPQYFEDLAIAMQDGKPYRGEFCNRAKDGTLYWVDTTIVPFLDDYGKIYQYLSINHDITERKDAENKIKQSEQLLKKLTDQAPGNTYMFEIEENGFIKILFSNQGTDPFNHTTKLENSSARLERLREVIHESDKKLFNDTMINASLTNSLINFQYRVVINGLVRWRWMQAVPETDENGKTVWYGSTSDITPLVDYVASIEQIIFDIGHVIRKPIASMLGITTLMMDNHHNEEELKEIAKKLHDISLDMDKFIKKLNSTYDKKRQNTKFNIDISSLIDKRGSILY